MRKYATDAGHGAARLEASAGPRFTQQDPPAPPRSRRDSMPAGLVAAQIPSRGAFFLGQE